MKKVVRRRGLGVWQSVLLTVLMVPCVLGTVFGTDVLTFHNDNARTGQNLKETVLTTSNVNSTNFGKLFTMPVDGIVDAQPLYLSAVNISGQSHNVVYVVTENDSVYAFDADTGAQLWRVSLLASGEAPSGNHGCSQISPQIGITATPVIDRSSGPHGTMYVIAMSKKSSTYFQRLHALDMTTGREEFGGPAPVQGKYPGNGDNSQNGFVVFDPGQYAERQGLLLVNHVIYTAWTSHCDIRPYTGWIFGFNESTLQRSYILNVTPNGNEGSIWQAGGGMASDNNGSIYFLDANGTFDTDLNSQGFPSMGDYGNAFVKIGVRNGLLKPLDYFNMFNTVSESNSDEDLGSGGAMVLPPMKDAGGQLRYLAIGSGKDSNIYIVDRNNMGKFHSSLNAIYQEVDGALPGGVWSVPAYFNGSVYYGPQGYNLLQFKFSQAKLASSPASKSGTFFTYPGSSPSISANQTSNGIVWAIEHTGQSVLHAYPARNLSQELYNSNQAAGGRDQFGTAAHFATPTIVDGKVFVGTTNSVAAFGLLK